MTVLMVPYDRNRIGSLYTARGQIIRKRTELIRKYGNLPSSRVWFRTIEEKDKIILKLEHAKFIQTIDVDYVQRFVNGILV